MAAAKGIDWDVVRKDYEEVGLNIAAIGLKYGVAATTVYQKARAEAWRDPLPQEIDPDCVEDEDYNIKIDVATYEQKKYLARLHREIDFGTSKPGEMKQWMKEGMAGNLDSRRKVLYQLLTLNSRLTALKTASAVLKAIVEVEIATGLLEAPGGKKDILKKAAKDLEDDRFAARSAPLSSPKATKVA
jgi:hypothetical protein